MAKKLTVHLRDKAVDTYVEMDGERLETSAVVYTGSGYDQELANVELLLTNVEVIDERSGAEDTR